MHKGALRATLIEVRAKEGHHHRHLANVRTMIEGSDLPGEVRSRAVAVFTRLAEAEARVHGTSVEEIHFHEVGALDAIIDIVGACAGFHALGVEQVYASAVPLGWGWGQMAHGQLPLPAPATLEILAGVRAPTRPAPGPGELLTPTGAALIAELAIFEQPEMTLHRVGIGAGQRDHPWPNVARMWLGERSGGGPFVQLETNIDDMNPQFYPAVLEKLLAAGAHDAWFTPVQMKKGRPGIVLSVLASESKQHSLAELLMRETTTLGVRVQRIEHRHEARREVRTVQTTFGSVRVKVKWVGDDPAGAMPEYEDCRAAAERAHVPIGLVHIAATSAAAELLATLRATR